MSDMAVNENKAGNAVSDAIGGNQAPAQDQLKQAFEKALANLAIAAMQQTNSKINEALKDMES